MTERQLEAKPADSRIEWIGKKVTGQHNGTLTLGSGVIGISDGLVQSGRFVFDLTSIVVLDIESHEWNRKLVDHLESEDFFNTQKYPEALFEITSTEPLESITADGANMNVKGRLTVKGITHEIEFPAAIHLETDSGHASGTIEVDRTLFDIRYGSGKFFKGLGDKMIHDTFTLKFDVMAKG